MAVSPEGGSISCSILVQYYFYFLEFPLGRRGTETRPNLTSNPHAEATKSSRIPEMQFTRSGRRPGNQEKKQTGCLFKKWVSRVPVIVPPPFFPSRSKFEPQRRTNETRQMTPRHIRFSLSLEPEVCYQVRLYVTKSLKAYAIIIRREVPISFSWENRFDPFLFYFLSFIFLRAGRPSWCFPDSGSALFPWAKSRCVCRFEVFG